MTLPKAQLLQERLVTVVMKTARPLSAAEIVYSEDLAVDQGRFGRRPRRSW